MRCILKFIIFLTFRQFYGIFLDFFEFIFIKKILKLSFKYALT